LICGGGVFSQVITFNDYKKASTNHDVLNEFQYNAEVLLQRVNALLENAGIRYVAGINAAARTETKSGAESYDGLHNYARAIDIADPDGSLYQAGAGGARH
jgi:hypothetical protein